MMSSLKSIILSCLFLIILSQKTCQDYCQPNGCNCYKVLNVATWAEPSEIKKSYRALTQQYHSDVNSGKDVSAKFEEITNCYEIFKDERSRAQYDWCIEKGSNYDSNSSNSSRSSDSSRNTENTEKPRIINDWFWLFLIFILDFIARITQKQNGKNEQTSPKKRLKSSLINHITGFIVAILLFGTGFVFMPEVTNQFFDSLEEWHFQWLGENIFFFSVVVGLISVVIYASIKKVFSLFGESPNEKEINNFFSDLRNFIDQFNGKILQRANEKKKNQESEITQAKTQELEILNRCHNENLSFVQQPENQEDELTKIHKRNTELCESRSEKKSRQENEAFNKFIESHNKTCEYYKKLASDTEKEMRLLSKEKKISHEKLKKELQRLADDIASKMSTNWQVDDLAQQN